MFDDLAQFEAHAWAMLEHGGGDRRSVWRTVALATVDAAGQPRLRNVILRAVDKPKRIAVFHTDVRSAKVAELRCDPRVALLAYDPAGLLQIRVEGRARLHVGDDATASAWSALPAQNTALYLQATAPGTIVALPQGLVTLPASGRDGDTGYEHFAVVVVDIAALETLYLGPAGHRRARFAAGTDGCWNHVWLAP